MSDQTTKLHVSQPGPLTAGAEHPSDLAWEAFFASCWTTYETLMARRRAKQKELKLITTDTDEMPDLGEDRA